MKDRSLSILSGVLTILFFAAMMGSRFTKDSESEILMYVGVALLVLQIPLVLIQIFRR